MSLLSVISFIKTELYIPLTKIKANDINKTTP
jgi:hypothetical protein